MEITLDAFLLNWNKWITIEEEILELDLKKITSEEGLIQLILIVLAVLLAMAM